MVVRVRSTGKTTTEKSHLTSSTHLSRRSKEPEGDLEAKSLSVMYKVITGLPLLTEACLLNKWYISP